MYNGIIVKNEKKTPLDDHSISFEIDSKNIDLYFGWENNDGEEWTFDLTLNHPDLDYSLHEQGRSERDIQDLLVDLIDELPELKQAIYNSKHNLCNDIIKAINELCPKSPSCTPEENYFGM